jgi:NAD(P)H dehydrogenase (quinone)
LYFSGTTKCAAQGDSLGSIRDHWLAERVFDWSGVTVAHIRPTYFAEWLLYLAPMIKAGRLHVPFGTGKHAPIATFANSRNADTPIADADAGHRGRRKSSTANGQHAFAAKVEVTQVPYRSLLG